jgi:hypothetical protein
MLAIKYVLLTGAFSMFIAAAVVLGADARKVMLQPESSSIRWRLFTRYLVIAVLLLLPGLSIVVVPSGTAGVRVSQVSGTLGGTIYPGAHFVSPLVLKDNPLLIQKIIAERLSDKVQIMMVPIDGKGFFANDVLKAATSGSSMPLISPTH